ncbi:MAG: hypothetical protein IJ158_02565 [Treponema sp.]|nr:hypothetical protein [Treponema sp.]
MQLLTDGINTILNGTESQKQGLQRSYFEITSTPPFLIALGLVGQKFTIRYGVITHHKKKDSDHDFTTDEWKQICKKTADPFAVERYENGFNLFLDLKHNDNYVLVGVEVKNTGKKHFVNAVKTIFAKNFASSRNIIYTSKKITPEQQSLLDGTNLRQYPANGR